MIDEHQLLRQGHDIFFERVDVQDLVLVALRLVAHYRLGIHVVILDDTGRSAEADNGRRLVHESYSCDVAQILKHYLALQTVHGQHLEVETARVQDLKIVRTSRVLRLTLLLRDTVEHDESAGDFCVFLKYSNKVLVSLAWHKELKLVVIVPGHEDATLQMQNRLCSF